MTRFVLSKEFTYYHARTRSHTHTHADTHKIFYFPSSVQNTKNNKFISSSLEELIILLWYWNIWNVHINTHACWLVCLVDRKWLCHLAQWLRSSKCAISLVAIKGFINKSPPLHNRYKVYTHGTCTLTRSRLIHLDSRSHFALLSLSLLNS